MDKSIFTALNSMQILKNNQSVLAQNLSNTNSVGFKKDIHANFGSLYMDRQKGIEMVLKYDHVVSDDLNYWLKYIDLKEEDFWRTADKFRDKNIWKIKKKKWHKIDIDGIEREYGEVNLTSKEINEYDS